LKRFILVVLLLAGCSEQATEALQVNIVASKAKVAAFEPVTITSTIVADGKPVINDAEVKFELIHPNGQKIGTLNPTNNGDGSYSIETSFDATGTYRIISHVDHNHDHDMPEVEVTVK
jgi:uncharacterized lipoprotein YajG